MNIDSKLKMDVLDELCFEPSIDDTEIGVIVKDGVVTLTGSVSNYAQKLAAEKAAMRVKGVKAVAEDIEVKVPSNLERTDTEIAEAAVKALQLNSAIPDGQIMVKVEDGVVYLSGELDWQYQKTNARNAISGIWGVKNVKNRIKLKSLIDTSKVKSQIKMALERAARIDAAGIAIETVNHEVILKGTVHSWAEKKDAEKAAFKAPGVWSVRNELKVA